MAFYDVGGEALVEELIGNNERAEFKLHQKTIRDMSDPFQLPDTTFKKIFRFNKNVSRIIINIIGQHMQEGQRNTAIPIGLKILATLNFYGTGSYQLSSGQGYNFAISQLSMSRCIAEVSDVIYNHLMPNWIIFPNNENMRNKVINGFRDKYNFPQCLGARDCTHIAIISPPEDYPALPYYCRKGYYSINCQIIADSDYNILNMNARFPGSTHDAAIWHSSNIKIVMENIYIRGTNYFLIGDSGYPLQPFLLTPFENTPESNYNYHFVRSTNVIETLNGILKSRFRCLSKHRVLNYDPIKAGKSIYSCGVLHNISRFYGDNLPEGEILDLDDDDLNEIENRRVENWQRRGEDMRNGIVQQYFSN